MVPIKIMHARKIPCFLLTFSFLIKNITTESNRYAITRPYIIGLKESTIQLNVPGLNTINKIISKTINIGSDIFKMLLYLSILLFLRYIMLAWPRYTTPSLPLTVNNSPSLIIFVQSSAPTITSLPKLRPAIIA